LFRFILLGGACYVLDWEDFGLEFVGWSGYEIFRIWFSGVGVGVSIGKEFVCKIMADTNG